MKTIAVFHPSNDLYGADRILVNALTAFPKEDRIIVYLPAHGPLTAFIEEKTANVEVKIIDFLPIIYRSLFSVKGIFTFLKNTRRFRSFFKKEQEFYQFDLAYVNTLACSFILPRLKKMKINSICHVHEIIENPRFIAKVTASLISKYSNRIVCVSKAVRDNLILHKKVITKKAIIVHNGIIPLNVSPKPTSETLNFYLFGRIMPKKGQWYLLEALRTIPKKELINCKFVMVGGAVKGSEHLTQDLQEKIQSYGLAPFVQLKGFASEISSAMEKADICLVPSLMKDPFPTTVLEAMSAGKPVIATDHGGAKEAIKNGENGYLVAPNKPKELAKAILQFIDKKESIDAFGSAAKNEFNTRFTMDHFHTNWLKALHF